MTITYLMYQCKRVEREREALERVVAVAELKWWPLEGGEFLHSRQVYEGLRTFARGALINRSDLFVGASGRRGRNQNS